MDFLNYIRPSKSRSIGVDQGRNFFRNTETPQEEEETFIPPVNNQSSTALDEYRKYISSAPNRKDHELNTLGKILAVASGTLSGSPERAINTTRSLLDRPYDAAMEDYTSKKGSLGEAAELERAENLQKYKISQDAIEAARNNRLDTSLIGSRNIQNQDRLDQISNRGRRSVTDKNSGKILEFDRAGNIIFEYKSDETPEERDAREFQMYQKEGDYKFGVDKNLAGYKFGLDKELDNYRSENDVDAHSRNRTFDVNNPITNTETIPSQLINANKLAIQRAIIADPSFEKFIRRGKNGAIQGARFPLTDLDDLDSRDPNPEVETHWNNFVAQVKKQEEDINKKPATPLNPKNTGVPSDAEVKAYLKTQKHPITGEPIDENDPDNIAKARKDWEKR